MHRRILVFCVLLWAELLSFRAAHAATVLDQNYDPTIDLGESINDGFPYAAQVVIAGIQGYLSRADLDVTAGPNSFADWMVTVNAVQGGVPTDTILASQLVPVNESTSLEVDFSSPAYFDAGDSFALVISAPSLPLHTLAGIWHGSFDEPYPAGGQAYESLDDENFSLISTEYPDSALAFDTYVNVPEPSGVPTLVATLGLLLFLRRPARLLRTN
jgi:hypothetical protein